jgi:hypothetical protein
MPSGEPAKLRKYGSDMDWLCRCRVSRTFLNDPIDHEGAVWLVPRWLPTEDDGYAMPERLIRLDQFAHQTLGKPGDPADFAINVPIPKALFDGPISPELKAQWLAELETMRQRIMGNRVALASALRTKLDSSRFDFLTKH